MLPASLNVWKFIQWLSFSVGLIHPFGHCRLPLARLGLKGPLSTSGPVPSGGDTQWSGDKTGLEGEVDLWKQDISKSEKETEGSYRWALRWPKTRAGPGLSLGGWEKPRPLGELPPGRLGTWGGVMAFPPSPHSHQEWQPPPIRIYISSRGLPQVTRGPCGFSVFMSMATVSRNQPQHVGH